MPAPPAPPADPATPAARAGSTTPATPADARPFDAVLCDVDGVLRHWEPLAQLDRAHGLPDGTLAAAAFRADLLRDAVTGAVTDEAWRTTVTDALVPACGGSARRARALVADWSARTGRVDVGTAGLLRAARRHVPVVLVTNQTTRFEADLAHLETLGLAGAFEAAVHSARAGCAKPDARIFHLAAEAAGVPLARCLVVDDTRGHVEAARAAGAGAVLHYERAAQLRQALAVLQR